MASCYTLGEVANHSSFNDAWVAVDDKVYNITPFLKSHPGGMAITKEYLGKDISDVIHTSSVHQHSDTAYAMLQDFHIGYLTKTQRGTVRRRILVRSYLVYILDSVFCLHLPYHVEHSRSVNCTSMFSCLPWVETVKRIHGCYITPKPLSLHVDTCTCTIVQLLICKKRRRNCSEVMALFSLIYNIRGAC